MKKTWLAACLAAVLLLAGCGGGAAAGGKGYSGDMAASSVGNADMDWPSADAAPSEPEEIPAGEAGWSTQESMQDSSVYQNARAKLIRRAELDIQTEEFDQSRQALNALVSGCGGYFEQSSVYGGSYRDAYANRRGEYVVRVPAEKYAAFLSSAGELGYVTSSTESTQDVGEEYYDTEARLKTQRTKQERLLALLEQAESMEDIIALEGALSDVEFQIEMYASDLNRYDALISYATFRIYLNEVGRITQDVGETSSLGARLAAGVQSSFRSLVQGGQELLVWVSYNLFLLMILAGGAAAVVFFSSRALRRQHRRSKTGEGEENTPK